MRVFTILGLMALVAFGSLAAQAYRLQYKDAAGANRTYLSEFTMKGAMSMPGADAIPIETVSKFTTLENIMKVANGTASIETKLKEGTIASTISGQQMTQPMPAFVITFDRTPRGDISNVKSKSAAGGLGGLSGMGDNQMQYLNQITGVGEFPDKELKIGDTWTTTETIEVLSGAKMEVVTTTVLSGTKVVDGKTYLVLDSDTTMKMPNQPVTVNALGQNITLQTAMQMQGKSSSLFNEAAGEFFNSTFKGNMSVTLTIGEEDGGFSTTTTMAVVGTTTKK